jgi:peptidoglycan/xylan/chitin deacetylase (PgdA/CDA1 family)
MPTTAEPMYFVKTPFYLKKIFSSMTWELPGHDADGKPLVYLTFDDGPDPDITGFVLDELARRGAVATFFLVGSRAAEHPELVARISAEGHAIGNHSWSHPNGWKTSDEAYLEDVRRCAEVLPTRLFRPPYGRIKITQIEALKRDYHIVMWDVISGDFDEGLSAEDCVHNVTGNAKPGSIVVLHDNPKAAAKVRHALPRLLDHFAAQGYAFAAVPAEAPVAG